MKLYLILVLALTLASLSYAAQVEAVNVPAGSVSTLTVNLQSGDVVSGSISITGGSGDDIDFSIKDPSGNEVFTKRRVAKGGTFSFTATQAGAYSMVFDNSMSLVSTKLVQVSYNYTPQQTASPSGRGGLCGAGAILLAAFGGLAILRR